MASFTEETPTTSIPFGNSHPSILFFGIKIRVNRISDRVKEAQKLGFKRIFIPKNNIDGWEFPNGIEVVGVSSVKEAIQKAF